MGEHDRTKASYPMTEPQAIRVSVKAVIVRDNQILLIGYDLSDGAGFHYNLPGGGVKLGEGLHEALTREVREEAGAEIEVGPLLFVTEYVPAHFDNKYGLTQSLQLYFSCTLSAGSKPKQPILPVDDQAGVHWLPLSDLPSAPLLPNIGKQLQETLSGGLPSVNPFIADW